MAQFWMIDNTDECIGTDLAFADTSVAVLVRIAIVETIIQMDRFQSVEADNTVEFFENAVEVVDDIIACVVDMARIETYAHFIRQRYTV